MGKRIVLTVVIVAAMAFCGVVDPVGGPVPYPRCPVKWLTGLDCPGCGGARAMHALLNGHPAEAWAYNPWLLPALLFVGLTLWADRRGGRLYRLTHSPLTLGAFVCLSLGYMAWRNLF